MPINLINYLLVGLVFINFILNTIVKKKCTEYRVYYSINTGIYKYFFIALFLAGIIIICLTRNYMPLLALLIVSLVTDKCIFIFQQRGSTTGNN